MPLEVIILSMANVTRSSNQHAQAYNRINRKHLQSAKICPLCGFANDWRRAWPRKIDGVEISNCCMDTTGCKRRQAKKAAEGK